MNTQSSSAEEKFIKEQVIDLMADFAMEYHRCRELGIDTGCRQYASSFINGERVSASPSNTEEDLEVSSNNSEAASVATLGLSDGNSIEHWLKEADDCANLTGNWDGYGGIASLPKIVSTAKKIITLLHEYPIYDLYPMPNGTITIEWVNSKEDKISLEIGEENYSYFVTGPIKKFVDGDDIMKRLSSRLMNDVNNLFYPLNHENQQP